MYVMYLEIGILVLCAWYLAHKNTAKIVDEMTFDRFTLFVIIYSHVWLLDVIKDLYKYFVLKVPFQEL